MKFRMLVLPVLVAAIFLPAESGSAQISNTFNSNFSANASSWSLSSNWTLVEGSGSAPLAPSDRAVVSSAVSRNLIVDADGIHVGELRYDASGAGTQRIQASGTRNVTIDTLTKGGSYALSIANNAGNSLSVQIGNLNLNEGSIEIGNPANGSLNGFRVTGTSTLGAELAFDGVGDRVAENNRIELGNLVVSGSGSLTLGGRGNSTGKAVVSSLSGVGTVQVSSSAAHNGTAGTLIISSANATPADFSGLLRDQALTQPAVLTVVKSGSGTQILSRSAGNTYSGTTTIEMGVLAVSNTSGSGLGTGPVSISDGGILAGSGIVALGSGNSITVKSGGSIAPAAHLEIGFVTLQLSGESNGSASILDMEEGSFFTLRFGTEDASDRISFINYHSDGLALFDGGISVNGIGVQEGAFTLFTFDSISSVELESFVELLRVGSGFGAYEADFFSNGNSILLGVTAVPEPRLTSLFAVAAALLVGVRWHRKVLAKE